MHPLLLTYVGMAPTTTAVLHATPTQIIKEMPDKNLANNTEPPSPLLPRARATHPPSLLPTALRAARPGPSGRAHCPGHSRIPGIHGIAKH